MGRATRLRRGAPRRPVSATCDRCGVSPRGGARARGGARLRAIARRGSRKRRIPVVAQPCLYATRRVSRWRTRRVADRTRDFRRGARSGTLPESSGRCRARRDGSRWWRRHGRLRPGRGFGRHGLRLALTGPGPVLRERRSGSIHRAHRCGRTDWYRGWLESQAGGLRQRWLPRRARAEGGLDVVRTAEFAPQEPRGRHVRGCDGGRGAARRLFDADR